MNNSIDHSLSVAQKFVHIEEGRRLDLPMSLLNYMLREKKRKSVSEAVIPLPLAKFAS